MAPRWRRRAIVLAADMPQVYAERLAHLCKAVQVIWRARGTERLFLREPDDQRLDQMARPGPGT